MSQSFPHDSELKHLWTNWTVSIKGTSPGLKGAFYYNYTQVFLLLSAYNFQLTYASTSKLNPFIIDLDDSSSELPSDLDNLSIYDARSDPSVPPEPDQPHDSDVSHDSNIPSDPFEQAIMAKGKVMQKIEGLFFSDEQLGIARWDWERIWLWSYQDIMLHKNKELIFKKSNKQKIVKYGNPGDDMIWKHVGPSVDIDSVEKAWQEVVGRYDGTAEQPWPEHDRLGLLMNTLSYFISYCRIPPSKFLILGLPPLSPKSYQHVSIRQHFFAMSVVRYMTTRLWAERHISDRNSRPQAVIDSSHLTKEDEKFITTKYGEKWDMGEYGELLTVFSKSICSMLNFFENTFTFIVAVMPESPVRQLLADVLHKNPDESPEALPGGKICCPAEVDRKIPEEYGSAQIFSGDRSSPDVIQWFKDHYNPHVILPEDIFTENQGIASNEYHQVFSKLTLYLRKDLDLTVKRSKSPQDASSGSESKKISPELLEPEAGPHAGSSEDLKRKRPAVRTPQFSLQSTSESGLSPGQDVKKQKVSTV